MIPDLRMLRTSTRLAEARLLEAAARVAELEDEVVALKRDLARRPDPAVQRRAAVAISGHDPFREYRPAPKPAPKRRKA